MVDSMDDQIDSSQENEPWLPNCLEMTNLKKQLQFYLNKRGISAAELARMTGVSKQVISLWSGGAKPKNIEQVKRVAEALGTTIDNLIFGNGDETESEKIMELDALLGSGWVSGFFEIKFRRVKK